MPGVYAGGRPARSPPAGARHFARNGYIARGTSAAPPRAAYPPAAISPCPVMRRPFCRLALPALVAAFGLALLAPPADAQYFGRNKVQYENFRFRVLQTEHFEIYYYPEAEDAARDAARMAERWYERHRRTYLNTFTDRKPIVLYANDADFQQTNLVSGQLGEGTGGVTTATGNGRQRVTMPLTGSYAETDHVLGHELVHAFQYDIALNKDTSGFNIGGLPLWLIEGTAEYLSIGRQDPHTAMWIRDAALRDDLPSTDRLTRDLRYFPYRYGQAYMAYVGGKYGDAAVANLYRMAGRIGVDSAFVYALGITADSLSNEWRQAVKDTYLPLAQGRTAADDAGRLVLSKRRGGGDLNVAPAVSPDGRYIAYLSERDLFNINLYIADAETGRVVRRLAETTSDPHFDAIRFISSAGSWSPDGKQLAFVTFVEGNNELSFFDVDRQRITRRVAVKDVGALSNPAWSPDGRSVAFTGLKGGISDLYLLDLASGAVRQLTDDRFADLQPAWSPDGRSLAFVTDRPSATLPGSDFEALSFAEMRLGVLDVGTGAVRVLAPFGNTLHHNPQFSRDGASLYFISDQDGFRDVYRTEVATGNVFRVTNLQTGVSGITSLSPAMTVSRTTGRLAFSVFSDNGYKVFTLEEAGAQGTPLTPRASGIATAGVLPPINAVGTGLVSAYLRDADGGLPTAYVGADRPYRARLRLDAVAPPTVGVGVGGYYGAGVQGGVGFLFSDLLNNHNLTVVAQANGTFKDIGGQVQYLNLQRRLNWGVGLAHIPYLQSGYAEGLTSGTTYEQQILRQRIYVSQASLLGAYPLSATRRFETDLGLTRYGFDYEVERFIYDRTTLQFIERVREDEESPDAIYFGRTGVAYVTDYSNFGFTSPVQGGRSRFQLSGAYVNDRNSVDGTTGERLGGFSFASVLADYRRYAFFRPFTFAFRAMHVGNYGVRESDATRIGQEYLYSSYYPTFVRGYGLRSFDFNAECPVEGNSCPAFERLRGTRIALANAELRIPVLGTRDFGLVNFQYLPTELSFFADAGLAWTADQGPNLKFVTGDALRSLDPAEDRVPVTSVGVSARLNILGYVIFETFYAYPFQRPDKGAHFGFALSPGW